MKRQLATRHHKVTDLHPGRYPTGNPDGSTDQNLVWYDEDGRRNVIHFTEQEFRDLAQQMTGLAHDPRFAPPPEEPPLPELGKPPTRAQVEARMAEAQRREAALQPALTRAERALQHQRERSGTWRHEAQQMRWVLEMMDAGIIPDAAKTEGA